MGALKWNILSFGEQMFIKVQENYKHLGMNSFWRRTVFEYTYESAMIALGDMHFFSSWNTG